jgi:hypothetical protein
MIGIKATKNLKLNLSCFEKQADNIRNSVQVGVRYIINIKRNSKNDSYILESLNNYIYTKDHQSDDDTIQKNDSESDDSIKSRKLLKSKSRIYKMTSESDNEPNDNNHNQTTTEAQCKEKLQPNSRNTRYTRILTTPPSSQITPTPTISTPSTLKLSPITPKTKSTTQNSTKVTRTSSLKRSGTNSLITSNNKR